MEFAVTQMRHRGEIVAPRDLANPLVGDLQVAEMMDPELRRMVRMASLIVYRNGYPSKDAAVLYEPSLIAMSTLGFSLSGWERLGKQCYVQSWLVRRARDVETWVPPRAASAQTRSG